MITLYVKTGCPFCAKAIAALKENNVPYEEKNIADPEVVKELIELGGKRQVPFLEDDNMTPYLVDDDVEMYESDAIVTYVNEKYSNGSTAATEDSKNLHVHKSESSDVCES